jgi:hypothetical protein
LRNVSDTIHLQSDGAPNGIGEHWWSDTEAVIAVPYKLALDLLHIPHGGFHQAEPYKALPSKPVVKTTPEAPKVAGGKSLVDQLTVSPVQQDDSPPLEAALDLVSPKGTRSTKKG